MNSTYRLQSRKYNAGDSREVEGRESAAMRSCYIGDATHLLPEKVLITPLVLRDALTQEGHTWLIVGP